MARGVYIGVGSKARKVNKMYVGVGGVAKKVKKGYIGVGGVARLFFKIADTITYYGETSETLSTGRGYLSAAAVGDYAIFAGGGTSSTSTAYLTATDAYDTSLTKVAITAKNGYSRYTGAGTIGNYAVFAGGTGSSSDVKVATAYDTSLSKSTPTSLSASRGHIGVATTGNYILFAGGTGNSSTTKVDCYNKSLTLSAADALSKGGYSAGATTGDYAVIVQSEKVDCYNSSLTKTTLTTTVNDAGPRTSTIVGKYAVFAGGSYNNDDGDKIIPTYAYAIDSSLTVSTITKVLTPYGRYGMAATTLAGHAMFIGGYNSNKGTTYGTVNTLNESLTISTATELATVRRYPAAVTVGDYALVGGGVSAISSVEVYQAT